MEEDWYAGVDFFKKFFSFGQERIFLRGNHDERIFDLQKNGASGFKRDFASKVIEEIEGS